MKYQKRFKILLSVAMATSSICVPITTIYAADETIALRETTPNVEASSESVPLMDPSHQLCEEIESLFIQSIDSIDYKIKLKSAEAKIKLLNNEEAQAFYQKEVMNIRAYREVVNEYTTLLEEATGDVELLYNGGRLDQIQEKMEAVHGMLQEGSPLNEMLKEKVKEIQDIKILCRNIRQALGALQIKDLDNENEITKTGHPFIEILETDKSDIYEAIRELERKNDNLRKVVDGFRTELQNIQIVKFKAERDALNDQKDRAKKNVSSANRECKVASLDALKGRL